MCTYVSDPQCVSSANHSAEWLKDNFGFFSRFASVTDFYKLNQNFSGVNLKTPDRLKRFICNSLKKQQNLYFIVNDFFSFVSSPAGGSSPPLSKTDSRDVAVASSYSTWERRCYQPSVWLPVGVPWRRETYKGPALPGPACQRGNSFVIIAYSNLNALLWMINWNILKFSGRSPLQCLQTHVSMILELINFSHILCS